MTIYIILATVIFFFTECKNKATNQTLFEKRFYQDVSLNPNGDTNFVNLQFSNICLRINYSDNKPKYVQVSNCYGGDSLKSEYAKYNRGVYFTLSSIVPNSISVAGFKYLNGDAGADISVNAIDGSMKDITSWDQYSNNGKLYDMENFDKGLIKVYIIKNAEKVDSFFYFRK